MTFSISIICEAAKLNNKIWSDASAASSKYTSIWVEECQKPYIGADHMRLRCFWEKVTSPREKQRDTECPLWSVTVAFGGRGRGTGLGGVGRAMFLQLTRPLFPHERPAENTVHSVVLSENQQQLHSILSTVQSCPTSLLSRNKYIIFHIPISCLGEMPKAKSNTTCNTQLKQANNNILATKLYFFSLFLDGPVVQPFAYLSGQDLFQVTWLKKNDLRWMLSVL